MKLQPWIQCWWKARDLHSHKMSTYLHVKHIQDSIWMGNSIQDFLWKLETFLIKKQTKDNLFLSILWYMPAKTNTYTGRGFSAIKISRLEQNWGYSDNRSKSLWKLKETSSCWKVYNIFSKIRLKHIKTVHLFGHFPHPRLDCPTCHLLPGLVPQYSLYDSTLSGMKVWVTSPGKEPGPAEVLTKGKGNTEWVVEGSSQEHQPGPCDQL